MGEFSFSPQKSTARPGMFHIILHEPEIPPNTGNVMRLCANTGARLHLVRPLGFSLDARKMRRAGLDYREFAQVEVHDSIAACLARLGDRRVFVVESNCPVRYTNADFREEDGLMFGSERRGLPASLVDAVPEERRLALPMVEGNRSLNLSNAVAAVTYEAWRQIGFRGAAFPRELPGS